MAKPLASPLPLSAALLSGAVKARPSRKAAGAVPAGGSKELPGRKGLMKPNPGAPGAGMGLPGC